MDNQCVHVFKIRLGKVWHLCPTYYSDEQFDRIMGMVDWYMPYNMAAIHINLGEFMPASQRVLSEMPVANLNVEKLFSSTTQCSVRLKDKIRREENNVTLKTGNYVISDTDDGYKRLSFVDGESCSYVTAYDVVPVHLSEAKEYMKRHRHNDPPQWHKFSIGLKCALEDDYVGMVVAGVPKAAAQARDRRTLDINRVCNDPRYANACSKLYAQAIKAGSCMGYTRFITYTLPEESGSSLKAVGFQFDGMVPASPRGWNQPSRPRKMPEKYPTGPKIRWVKEY